MTESLLSAVYASELIDSDHYQGFRKAVDNNMHQLALVHLVPVIEDLANRVEELTQALEAASQKPVPASRSKKDDSSASGG